MQKRTTEEKLFTKVKPAGYIYISKETPIPESLNDAKLFPYDSGPVNTQVEKPFRVYRSPVNPTDDFEDSALAAYQALLIKAKESVAYAKGTFVLYIEAKSFKIDTELIGGLYKIGSR